MSLCKTLIISKYEDTSSLIKTALEDADISSVSLVKSLQAGLAKFKTGLYGLVIIDCLEFNDDFLQLIEKMRLFERKQNKYKSSIVIISSNMPESWVKKSIINGASFLIKKPFSANILNKRVEHSFKYPVPKTREINIIDFQ